LEKDIQDARTSKVDGAKVEAPKGE